MESIKKFIKSKIIAKIFCLAFFLILLLSKQINAQCINIFPHIEDFETAPVWTNVTRAGSVGVSDWAWGTPNHTYVIQSAGSGSKCWCAGGLTGAFYNNWEQSYIVSPCYDFSTLLYPHIKFKLFYDTEYHFDGGNLQSSIDGGTTWVDVGTVGGTNTTPIIEPNDCNTQNWYDYPGINYLNNPTGFVTSMNGWAGNTQAGGAGWDPNSTGTNCLGGHGPGHWITAEHCLTGLAGQPNVLLRFTFGSGYTCNNFDGLAIDSVAVSNGISNSASFAHTCGTDTTLNFTSTFAPCPQTNAWDWNFGDPASGASNTATTQNASHTFSGPGSYTVTLIAKGGACNPPDTIIQVVNVMSATITASTNVSCFGGNDGSATVTVNSGLAPINYSWAASGGNAGTATNLAQGTYTVSITDAGSCPATATVTITQPPLLTVTTSSTPASCSGTGSATATVTGGTAAYTYLWNPSGGTGSTANGLTAGNYTVNVTDNLMCTATASVVVSNSAGGLSSTVTSTNVSCNGGSDGTATVNPTAGTGPYTYAWAPSGGTAATALDLAANTYTCTITDVNLCAGTQTVTITAPTGLTATSTQIDVLCFGGNNGSATVTASGATPSYTYSWAPSGGTAATAASLTAGNYTCTVTDLNSCSITVPFSIIQPAAALTATATSTTASCGQSNGTATVTTSGGTINYTYAWSPAGGNSTTATGLIGGTYTVTVTDAHACTTTAITTVNSTSPFTITTSSTPVTCFGGNDGSATAAPSGSAGPFTYQWLPNGGNLDTTGAILSFGTYTVNITDNTTGCQNSATVNVTQPSALTVTPSQVNVLCFGGNDGSATVVASGATPAYTYAWTPSGGNAATASALTAGNYTCTITDQNLCSVTEAFIITEPAAALTATITNTTATCGQANGTATVTALGGTSAYTYAWSPTGGNATTATGLNGGIYTVTVTDAHSCTTTTTTTVAATTAVTVTANSTPVTCFGGSDGSATASASGSAGPFTYQWQPSGGNAIATGTILPAGIYTVSVTDNITNCQNSTTVNLIQPAGPVTVVANGQTACRGQSVNIVANASGGNGAPFSYTWSNGTTVSITNVSPGTNMVYTVTVVDSKNCLAQDTAVLNLLAPLAIVVTSNDTICPGKPATLSAAASGGNGNYTITWTPGSQVGSSVSESPTTTTTYTATVTDGCTVLPASATGQVVVTSVPIINYGANPASGCAPVCPLFAGVATNVPGNNIVPSSYTWAFGDGTTASGINASHCYTTPGIYYPSLHATTTKGCTDSSVAGSPIYVYPKPHADFTASTFETDIYNNEINFTNTSTGVIASYSWNFAQQGFANTPNASYTFSPEGSYPVTLIVINQEGCRDTIIKNIIINPDFTFYIPNAFTPNAGDELNDFFLPLGTGWDDKRYNFWVFDRWGNKIFYTKDVNQGWDGRANEGRDIAQIDTYVWKVELYDVFNKKHSYYGQVNLIK